MVGGGKYYQHYLQSPIVKFRKALCSAKKATDVMYGGLGRLMSINQQVSK